jgi:hypothetical protein
MKVNQQRIITTGTREVEAPGNVTILGWNGYIPGGVDFFEQPTNHPEKRKIFTKSTTSLSKGELFQENFSQYYLSATHEGSLFIENITGQWRKTRGNANPLDTEEEEEKVKIGDEFFHNSMIAYSRAGHIK